MADNPFDQLKRQSAKSFNDQKALIKKVLSGREVKCQQCRTIILFSFAHEQKPAQLSCKNGCTNIELDIAL